MLPLRWDDDGYAIFSSVDIDDYGMPESWGYDRYLVVEEPTYQIAYADHWKAMAKHQYCRVTRFRLLVGCLLNQNSFSSKKGKKCLKKMGKVNLDLNGDKSLWDHCCTSLKDAGFKKYYNWIPVILGDQNILDCSPNVKNLMASILLDFFQMHLIFDSVKNELGRKYFLPLRYTALKLAIKNGYDNPLKIPIAKTKIRLKKLDNDFAYIWQKIEDRKLGMFSYGELFG